MLSPSLERMREHLSPTWENEEDGPNVMNRKFRGLYASRSVLSSDARAFTAGAAAASCGNDDRRRRLPAIAGAETSDFSP
jgi:hypothetical protein